MDTKHTLLSHAEHLARRQGFDAFSFADLANGAGIRKASVHHHFPTKGDLAVGLVNRYADHVYARLRPGSGASGGARLTDVLALYRDALEGGDSLCLCVALSLGRHNLPEAAKTALYGFQTRMLATLTEIFALAKMDGSIRHVDNPGAEAAAAFALVEGAQVMARTASDLSLFDTATAALVARIQTGAPQ